MRILIACHSRDILGGTESYVRAVLPALAARGHHLALFHEVPFRPNVSKDDMERLGLPIWDGTDSSGSVLASVSGWRPDVIYVQGLRDQEREQAFQSCFPTVLFAHNYYGTCISGYKRFTLPRVCSCTRVLGPACLALYLPRGCGGRNPWTMWQQYRSQRRRQAMLHKYQAMLVASRHMLDEYRRQGIRPDRLHVAPLFSAEKHPDDQPPPDRPSAGRILFVGRITEVKGSRLLVPALARASQLLGQSLTLEVAGDGAERAVVETMARDVGLPTVFHGWVNASRREELMRGADLLAVPSIWPEPFGLVGLEAGGVGLPSVGFAAGGIPDWLIPGESGESAPGHRPSVEGLADAVVRALADSRHLARLRRGAWEMSRRFTIERHLEILEPVLARAAEGKP